MYYCTHILLVGDIPKCLQAAVSYLLFEPNDETMLKNLEFYGELEASKNVELKPRNVSHIIT